MAFGIGAGIFFGHLPFVKVNGVPGTTYRIWPGAIFSRVCKRLGVKMESHKFGSPDKAMQALDEVIAKGIPVGMQSSVYYLPYFPASYRFHFNAHNLVVYGKENGDYLVSDPIMDTVTTIDYENLVQARFAKGFPEPKGENVFPRKRTQTGRFQGTDQSRHQAGLLLYAEDPHADVRRERHPLPRQKGEKLPGQSGRPQGRPLPRQHHPHAGRDRHGRGGLPFYVRRFFYRKQAHC